MIAEEQTTFIIAISIIQYREPHAIFVWILLDNIRAHQQATLKIEYNETALFVYVYKFCVRVYLIRLGWPYKKKRTHMQKTAHRVI